MGKNDKYLIGIKDMDDQHGILFEIIDEMRELPMSGNEDKPVEEMLNRVIGFIKLHFSAEEALMTSHKFPVIKQHLAEHKKFIQQIINFHKRMTAGVPPTTYEIISLLQNWLTDHIRKADKEYADFILKSEPAEVLTD